MKRFILLFVLGILQFNAFAQGIPELDAGIVIKGGYNFLEKQPVSSVTIFRNVAFLRFSLSYNFVVAPKSSLQPTQLPIFSPAIGLCYGEKNVVHLTCGVQPWGVFNKQSQTMTSQQQLRVSFDLGYDIRLGDRLFLSIGAYYLLPVKDTETEHFYRNLSLMAGLGFRL